MTNRLTNATSPYLRQHASNPVDWYPWGEEAFIEAREQDRPILLSIGYSSCHWCHVMAHESFEDPEIAELMNRSFVSMKVDREEHPDIDQLYMDAVVALTGSGGWPLTVFLTPAGEPFFGGTYFPPERRGSMMSFPELLETISALWRDRRDDVTQQAAQLTNMLRDRADLGSSDQIPSLQEIELATTRLIADSDPVNGGFGSTPKFPQVPALEFLLARFHHTGDERLLDIVARSADAMASGGIHDHIGGGFSRYSVDQRWLVPHFEKMLYDQALLGRLYLHLWQLTAKPGYLEVLERTIAYVLRDLRHPDGGFFCGEDADSEGVEGKFYLWSPSEIRETLACLGPDVAEAAIDWWGVTKDGNFEGANILWHPGTTDTGLTSDLRRARDLLLEQRAQRMRPGLDDKVVLEWNGLMIATLAEAASATGRRDWLEAATRAGEFALQRLRNADGRWMRSWHGHAHIPAVAVDHAAITDAFIALATATGQALWIDEARSTAASMIELFWDHAEGGFFTGGNDVDRLVVRSKDLTDMPTASANSLAASVFHRLGTLTGDTRLVELAQTIMLIVGPLAIMNPHAFPALLSAMDTEQIGLTEVVITGDRPDLVEVATGNYLPSSILTWGEAYDSPLWEGRSHESGAGGRAHVCRNYTCRYPTTDPDVLAGELGIDAVVAVTTPD